MSQARIIAANTPELTSTEMAAALGYTPRYVRKVRTLLNLPRPGAGARRGDLNHAWNGGRTIDLTGYALVRDNPRAVGVVAEHRLVVESSLGRSLHPHEVVDHIDGLTLHNSPENLRVFASNGEHLRSTLTGLPHSVSASGRRKLQERHHGTDQPPVDTYRRRKERGDVRLQQILLAALQLGTDSPFLLGTHSWLEQAGIDWQQRSNLERGLAALYQRFEQDLLL